MVGAGRPSVAPYALRLDRLGLAELLGRDDRVMPVAQVLGVLVDIKAAMREGHLVVHDGGEGHEPFSAAVLA